MQLESSDRWASKNLLDTIVLKRKVMAVEWMMVYVMRSQVRVRGGSTSLFVKVGTVTEPLITPTSCGVWESSSFGTMV